MAVLETVTNPATGRIERLTRPLMAESLLFRDPAANRTTDRLAEDGGDAVGEVQGGVVLLGLQRIDRLARHSDGAAQLLLGPAALGAKFLHAVLHRLVRMKGETTPKQPQKTG
jgi:hypothetical protein